MRITLVAANGYLHDRRALALHTSLDAAGHDVTVVAATSRAGGAADVTWVPTRRPVGPGRWRVRLREAQSDAVRARLLRAGLVRATVRSAPDQIVPTTAAAVEAATAAARRCGAVVVADPRIAVPDDVWATHVVPGRPQASRSVAGGLPHHTPGWDPVSAGARPASGRHAGTTVVLVYRQRAASPGRYVHEALERAGVEVVVHDDVLDTAAIPAGAAGVLIVESPYPAVQVSGPPATVPVVFWVHHGEHHLDANVRLADRYGADHVLLAHSWHLAARFAQPVTRFPFALPLDLSDGGRPFTERRYDVAMVGSHLDGGGPYARRGELVRRTRAHLGADRVAFLGGVTPAEMMEVYGDARMVLNEGGTRHHPITMRVFEAVAAGAVLLTDPTPGLDQLLDPEAHTAAIDEPLEHRLDALLADPGLAERGAAALAHARAHHTYDHRVDELLAVFAATTPGGVGEPRAADAITDPLAAAVDTDAEVQVLCQVGAPEVAAVHGDREVWSPDERAERLGPGSMEAVAIRCDDVTQHLDVLRAAWRYLYVAGDAVGLDAFLAAEHPRARSTVVTTGGGQARRIDLMASGYRLEQPAGPPGPPAAGPATTEPDHDGPAHDPDHDPHDDPEVAQ